MRVEAEEPSKQYRHEDVPHLIPVIGVVAEAWPRFAIWQLRERGLTANVIQSTLPRGTFTAQQTQAAAKCDREAY